MLPNGLIGRRVIRVIIFFGTTLLTIIVIKVIAIVIGIGLIVVSIVVSDEQSLALLVA